MKFSQILICFFIFSKSISANFFAAPAEFYDKECFKRKKGKTFLLVENGKALCPILITQNCSPRTREAVEELKSYLKKISGAEFKVEIADPNRLPPKAIWIGYHSSFEKIFKQIDADLKLEEIRIVANQNHLAIFGDDGPNGSVRDIVIEGSVFANAQASYGTINAIYSFIQDFLGVRWFWPGELGEDFPEKKSIAIDPVDFKYQPQMISRYGIMGMYRPGRRPRFSEGDQWSARQRLFYSSTLINFGHSFKDYWAKYSERFPLIFALTEKGDRKPIDKGETIKLCVSNQDMHQVWLAQLDELLRENPLIAFFNIGENDSYHTGHCVCENCTKLDAISVFEKEKNLSDRNVYLANTLTELMKTKFGKNNKFKVLYTAYGNTRPLPIKTKLNPDIGVISVANFHLRRKANIDPNQNIHIKQYLDWSKQSNTVFWRPNLGDPVGLTWGFYDVAFSQSFENFKFVADNNCKGIYFDLFREHWSTQGIQYYVDAQLAWNPYLNKEALMNDYFSRLYGPAHAEMRSFWNLVENTRNTLYEKYGDLARFWIFEEFKESWFGDAQHLLSAAEKKLAKAPKKYLARLQFVQNGFQYARLLVDLRKSIYDFEQGNAKEKNQSFKTVEDILLLTKSFDTHALNVKVLQFDTEGKLDPKFLKRMEGLLPNAPLRKKTLRMMDEGLE
jgi:hypothetical protein